VVFPCKGLQPDARSPYSMGISCMLFGHRILRARTQNEKLPELPTP